MVCLSCGQPLAGTEPACPRCGRPLIVACPRCGGVVSVGARFCGACGVAVMAPPSVAPPVGMPPPPSMAPAYAPPEQILVTIPEARVKTGLFGSEMYVLVVTDRRLIGAKVTGDLLKRIIEEARAGAKAEGGGFFRQWAAQIGASVTLGRRYGRMQPDAILAETPGNWMLLPNQARSIKVERRRRDDEDRGMHSTHLRIKLETPSGTTTYETDTENPDAGTARAILAQVFGPAVR